MIVLADKAYDSDRIRDANSRTGSHAQHPSQIQPEMEVLIQQVPLPRAQPDRAALLQAKAHPPDRHPLRHDRRQIPRHGSTRLNTPLVPRL